MAIGAVTAQHPEGEMYFLGRIVPTFTSADIMQVKMMLLATYFGVPLIGAILAASANCQDVFSMPIHYVVLHLRLFFQKLVVLVFICCVFSIFLIG